MKWFPVHTSVSQPPWLINLDKCIPQQFSKYLQISIYEEGQSLHNAFWNINPQQLALGIVSTSHLSMCSLHNLTCEISLREMDLRNADGLKSQQLGDMTALPASARSTHSFSILSWALWIERSPSKANSRKFYSILSSSKRCSGRYLLGCILLVYRDCNCYKVTPVLLILANFVLAHLSWFACRAQVSNTNNCVS